MPPTTATKVVTHNGIVSLDPSNPISDEVKPLISDIIRTKYCIQGSIFLVEAIDVIRPEPGKRLIRLLLGDGELVIQGFLQGNMHWVVTSGKVFEGSYVSLDKFGFEEGMREVDTEKGGEVKEKEYYLTVGDLRTVGWDEEYLGLLKQEGMDVKDVRELAEKKEGGKLFGMAARAKEMEERRRREMEEERERVLKEEEERRRLEEEEERKRQEAEVAELMRLAEEVIAESDDETGVGKDEDHISGSDYEDDVLERMEFSPQKATQRRAMATEGMGTNNVTSPQWPPPFKLQPQAPKLLPQPSQPRHVLIPKPPCPQPQPQPQNTTPKNLPWNSDNPFQPLKLTPLSQIPHLPYKQNWKINTLVVATQLGEVEPCTFPPYVQRQARVIDQSTLGKHIHLTVFLDPDSFTPRLGEVYLLLGVKNHQFDGGSLKKYVSDKPKGGARWWVEGRRLGWCQGMVDDLMEWWAQHPGNGHVADGS